MTISLGAPWNADAVATGDAHDAEPDVSVRRPIDAWGVAAGLAVLVAGMVIVRHGTASAPERDVFAAVNDLPDGLYPVAWPFEQVGNTVVGPVVALVAWRLHRRRLALAVVAATLAKLALERVVKVVVTRERPGTSMGPGVRLRGEVPPDGESFVSGHAVLVAALACLVTPYLPRRWKAVPWVLLALVLVVRVYVGAHFPLDVVCGAALGIAIGSGVNLAFGVPSSPPRP